MLHEINNAPTPPVLMTPAVSQPRSAQPNRAVVPVTEDRARAKRKLDYTDDDDDESDRSTATDVCIGDRVYTITIENEIKRNRHVEVSHS